MGYKTAIIVLFTSLFWVVVPQKKSRMYPIYYLRKKHNNGEDEHFMPKFKIKTASCINLCTRRLLEWGVKGLMICWAETLHARGCCDSGLYFKSKYGL
jgi:hypothetical protein